LKSVGSVTVELLYGGTGTARDRFERGAIQMP
jgi:hypothetical protein